MNRALLAELQKLVAYPSVTLLHTTSSGPVMRDADVAQLTDLVREADDRLRGDVDDDTRHLIVGRLEQLVESAAQVRATRAVAICASQDHEAIVRLGRDVTTRVVIDHTFATRDMVADVGRTATFRVVTVSERKARLLVGDRDRLVEVDDETWPLVRDDDEGDATWRQAVNRAIAREQVSYDIPTVFAGVAHTVDGIVDAPVEPAGTVPGNHDRTGHRPLHELAWPVIEQLLDGNGRQALARLDQARGARIFAGGVDEVWDLANDGRVELLVVEDDYQLAARVDAPHLVPAADVDGPDVVDDVVDELIETVLRSGGETVMVPPGELAGAGRLAAVLRY